MKIFNLKYKTLLIELLLKLRALISISLLLGIDLGLSFNEVNEEEGIGEVEETEIEDLINNEELPLSQTEPESEPMVETNNDDQDQNRDIMKAKEEISEIMDVTTAGINAAIIGLGAAAFQQSPTITTRVTTAATTLAAVSFTSAGLTAMKHKILDSYDEYTDIDNRPPSPGHGEFNLIDTNSLYDN